MSNFEAVFLIIIRSVLIDFDKLSTFGFKGDFKRRRKSTGKHFFLKKVQVILIAGFVWLCCSVSNYATLLFFFFSFFFVLFAIRIGASHVVSLISNEEQKKADS